LEDEHRDTDVLEWWKRHESDFPALAILAKRYLAIPASSAPSERIFSKLKNTATAKRHNLSPQTLCQLLFVAAHQDSLSIV
jgi:hAT family C-terminal dimerisation region